MQISGTKVLLLKLLCVYVCEYVTPAVNLAQWCCVSLGEVIKQRVQRQRSLSVVVQQNTYVTSLLDINHTSHVLAHCLY